MKSAFEHRNVETEKQKALAPGQIDKNFKWRFCFMDRSSDQEFCVVVRRYQWMGQFYNFFI